MLNCRLYVFLESDNLLHFNNKYKVRLSLFFQEHRGMTFNTILTNVVVPHAPTTIVLVWRVLTS